MTFSKLARIGVCASAMAIVPAALPASAQTHNSKHTSNNAASATDQNSDLVPGTGMTSAELQDIGYSQQQISQIRTDMLAEANNGPMDQNTNGAVNNPNTQANNAAANPGTQANNGGGGGGWGLWGLVGLLGLLGLGRGRRAETVRDERDRDVRRIA